MKMKTMLLVASLLLTSWYQAIGQCESTIGSLYGTSGSDEGGNCLTATKENDGMYVAGTRGDSVLLLKVDLDGKVLWSRTFNVVPNLPETPGSIILDSEGMLAIVGIIGDESLGGKIFLFRYNPNTDQILWAKEYIHSPNNFSFDILQKGDGGNYVILNNPTYYTDNHLDTELLEIDKNSGDLNPSFAKNYTFFGTESLWDIAYDGHFIYGTGRWKDGGLIEDFRNTIVKLDPNNGSQIWVKMGHRGPNEVARLYGTDLVVDQNEIVSIYWGDPTGTSTTNTKIYIQKTHTDGDLIWLKQYELPGQNDLTIDICKSGDGFTILSNKGDSGEFILFKINTDGSVEWAKIFHYPLTNASNVADRGKAQLLQIGNQLVFTGYAIDQGSNDDIIIIRTDLNGEVQGPCVENESITIPIVNISNPTFYNITAEEFTVTPEVNERSPVMYVSNIMPLAECVLIDTILTSISATICAGEIFEGYSQTGIYTDTFSLQNGCDSVRILNLTVTPSTPFTLIKEICLGGSFEGYNHTGIFSDTFQTTSGCDSIRVLHLSVISCLPLIHYDLEDCESYMVNGSHMDYSEFVPAYPNPLTCADVTANYLFRDNPQENKHSCTPGVNGSVAMCVSTYPSCTYSAADDASVVIEFNVNPHADSIVRITGFEFYEKGPLMYSWIDGPTGQNNYPRRYGIRILKNGVEIFRVIDILTTTNWTLQSFNFIDNDLFRVTENTSFRIELLPYCPVGNGAMVSAWDIDEVRIFGGCVPVPEAIPTIQGNVLTKIGQAIPNAEMQIAENTSFSGLEKKATDANGYYLFDQLEMGNSYYLKGYKNDDPLNGVNTLDLIHIQRHLLGITPFTTLDQFIAADANRSGNISAIDLLEIRKLILGFYSEFPNNTSWRFGCMPLDMSGTDISTFREIGSMEYLSKDTQEMDFVGIKIGDLNGDVVLQAQAPAIESRNSSWLLSIGEKNFTAGFPVSVDIKAKESNDIEGIQLAFNLKELHLVSVKAGKLNIGPDNYSLSNDGLMRLSWNQTTPIHISTGDVLFTIELATNQSGEVSEFIKLDGTTLSPEAYHASDLLPIKLDLIFEGNQLQPVEKTYFTVEPNPFQENFNIRFDMMKDGNAQFLFYDLSGRLVHQIQNNYLKGENTEQFISRDIFSQEGVIYCQLITDGFTATQKIVKVD
ncbi:MAG TPA: T9SS type A sorting domain-containing protein [Saprospiraceae bacterium]|nr:T9SS type A sorting domain-containing protein [Saprospiraceae bacterium]